MCYLIHHLHLLLLCNLRLFSKAVFLSNEMCLAKQKLIYANNSTYMRITLLHAIHSKLEC